VVIRIATTYSKVGAFYIACVGLLSLIEISRNLKQVRRYHKRTCKDLPLLWQAQLKAVKAPQSESQYDDCHVIVLHRAGGKSVGRTKQLLQQLLGVQVRVRLRLGDHSIFPPLVF
jgi:hypothetical protein